MIDRLKFFGDASYKTVATSGSLTLDPRICRFYSINASPAPVNVFVVDARLLKKGMVMYVLNYGANTFDVERNTRVAPILGTLVANDVLRAELVDNSTQGGTWVNHVSPQGT